MNPPLTMRIIEDAQFARGRTIGLVIFNLASIMLALYIQIHPFGKLFGWLWVVAAFWAAMDAGFGHEALLRSSKPAAVPRYIRYSRWNATAVALLLILGWIIAL